MKYEVWPNHSIFYSKPAATLGDAYRIAEFMVKAQKLETATVYERLDNGDKRFIREVKVYNHRT